MMLNIFQCTGQSLQQITCPKMSKVSSLRNFSVKEYFPAPNKFLELCNSLSALQIITLDR